ncbi:MAG TPA: hypothetical protein DIU00_05215, partial [Phycisphaerales bacterium]|nr:hypothetical protein [Phycisphaerales bacterium]
MSKEVKDKAVSFVLLIGYFLFLPFFSASAFGQCPEDLYYWVAGMGNWSMPDNWRHEEWDPDLQKCVPVPGVPGLEDTVYIENSGTVTISSVANAKGAYIQFSSNLGLVSGSLAITDRLHVDWGEFFEQSGGQTSARYEDVGHRGTGKFIQTGGKNLIQDCLFIGRGAGSNGTYELVGGELSAFEVEIGDEDDGTGRFIQTGGMNTVFGQGIPSGLSLARGVGAVGKYELINGTVVTDEIFMGRRGEGTFVQSGGKVTVNTLFVGPDPGSEGLWCNGDGTYELHGGTIDVGGWLCVGAKGMGSFVMDGGTINATDEDVELTVFRDTGSLTGPGTFNIEVIYKSEEIYGTYGDDSIDVIFGRYDLYKGGVYNVEQISPDELDDCAVGILLDSSAFDVTFDGEFSGEFAICIPYDEAEVAALNADETSLQVLHEIGPGTCEILEDVYVDTDENVVYGKAGSLSRFALFVEGVWSPDTLLAALRAY